MSTLLSFWVLQRWTFLDQMNNYHLHKSTAAWKLSFFLVSKYCPGSHDNQFHFTASPLRTDFPQPAMEVNCLSDGVQVGINFVEQPDFNGVLYVKGHSKDEQCRRVVTVSKDSPSYKEVFKVNFGRCGLIHVNVCTLFIISTCCKLVLLQLDTFLLLFLNRAYVTVKTLLKIIIYFHYINHLIHLNINAKLPSIMIKKLGFSVIRRPRYDQIIPCN